MSIEFFNFRDIVRVAGLPADNETHWAVGQIIRKKASELGVNPQHLLTAKTNPDPSVSAPHMIAHYPMSIYEDCVEAVMTWIADGKRQFGLFEEHA